MTEKKPNQVTTAYILVSIPNLDAWSIDHLGKVVERLKKEQHKPEAERFIPIWLDLVPKKPEWHPIEDDL